MTIWFAFLCTALLQPLQAEVAELKHDFKPGMQVRLYNIKKKSMFNGLECVIENWLPDRGAWKIKCPPNTPGGANKVIKANQLWPVDRGDNYPTFPDDIPETRPQGCTQWSDEETLSNHSDLKVSVIIPWLGEKWLHLQGTLMSLLKHTPDELVEEYLFISDSNKNTYEKELTAMSPKVRVVELKTRHGLIKAKTMAVEMAKAPVMLFLEGHCIVTPGWLPPLLERVRINPRVVAMPMLDVIPVRRWGAFGRATPGHWRFEWNLNVIMTNPGGTIKNDSPDAYPSPAASGGILAIRKDWFQRLGLYDIGMLEWGGDHVEMSFKAWRCGGRVEIVPCSRIGHLFRGPEDRPYPVETMQVVKNYGRLAEVWFNKEELDIFYRLKPEIANWKPNREEHEALKKKRDELQCHDHQWYIDNVDFEMQFEKDKVCHPFTATGLPTKCTQAELVPGRWTVKDAISAEDYLRRKNNRKQPSEEL